MRRWYPMLLIAIAIAVSVAVYPQLPDRVPTHWNVRGEVDGWSSRAFGAFLIPIIMIAVAVLTPLLPKIDPRRSNYARFEPTYWLTINLVLTFMLGVHFMTLAVTLGADIPVVRVIPFGVGALFAIIGNVMPRTRSNWSFGIRTPWTLASDRVWERTHRVGGWMMFAGGLIVMAGAIAAPTHLIAPITICSILGATAGAFIYSYAAWRQEQRP